MQHAVILINCFKVTYVTVISKLVFKSKKLVSIVISKLVFKSQKLVSIAASDFLKRYFGAKSLLSENNIEI